MALFPSSTQSNLNFSKIQEKHLVQEIGTNVKILVLLINATEWHFPCLGAKDEIMLRIKKVSLFESAHIVSIQVREMTVSLQNNFRVFSTKIKRRILLQPILYQKLNHNDKKKNEKRYKEKSKKQNYF